MARPWDIKLVSQLSESEMMAYVNHLEAEDVFRCAEDIDQQIEAVVDHWRVNRNAPTYTQSIVPYRHITSLTPSRGYYYLHGASYKEVQVRVYPWMDEKHVRYVAREQLMEQQND
jgi:hypothetical protein